MSKFKWPWQKKKQSSPKPINQEFADYANTKKLQEFHRYLNQISKYFNNPLNQLFKQRGMLLETFYHGKLNTAQKDLLRRDVDKIDGMIRNVIKIDKPIMSGKDLMTAKEFLESLK